MMNLLRRDIRLLSGNILTRIQISSIDDEFDKHSIDIIKKVYSDIKMSGENDVSINSIHVDLNEKWKGNATNKYIFMVSGWIRHAVCIKLLFYFMHGPSEGTQKWITFGKYITETSRNILTSHYGGYITKILCPYLKY